MKHILAPILLLTFLFVPTANSQTLPKDIFERGTSTSVLFKMCASVSEIQRIKCKTYILGVTETIFWIEFKKVGKDRSYCIKRGNMKTIGQIRERFIKEVVANKSLLKMPAAPAVIMVTNKMFPCP
jgi:hypothetical protein